MNVDLISITKPEIKGIKNPEDLVAFCARVSNPSNQMNIETAPKLLKFLIKLTNLAKVIEKVFSILIKDSFFFNFLSIL